MKSYKIGFVDKGVLLLVEDSVQKKWDEHRQKYSDTPEACGILMASIDSDTSRIWLEKATVPKKSDNRTRFTFKISGKNHQKELDLEAKNSGGKIRLLGTWHTHPEDDPSPSQADFRGWERQQEANPQFREFCFVIVGLKSTSAYLSVNNRITKMKFISLNTPTEK